MPLYRFVLSNVVSKYDLDRADGRVDAVREAARLVSSIRDKSKVDAFSRELAGMVGVDIEQAREEVRRAAQPPSRRAPSRDCRRSAAAGAAAGAALPDPREPRFAIERETLKLVLQHPAAVGRMAADVGANDFTHPTYRVRLGAGREERRPEPPPTPAGPRASAPTPPTRSSSRRSARSASSRC